MFKTKGAMFGVAVALVATALIVAGMAVGTTPGAATDIPGSFSGAPSDLLTGSDPGNPTGNPPAAPVEPPTAPTNPGIDPTGGAGAGTGAPGSLPNAGIGGESGNSTATMVLLLGLAGALVAGAGATAATASRRK